MLDWKRVTEVNSNTTQTQGIRTRAIGYDGLSPNAANFVCIWIYYIKCVFQSCSRIVSNVVSD